MRILEVSYCSTMKEASVPACSTPTQVSVKGTYSRNPLQLLNKSRRGFNPLQLLSRTNAGHPVQRILVRNAPVIVKNKDLAQSLLSFLDFGVTPFIINGHEMPPSKGAGVINGPVFNIKPIAPAWFSNTPRFELTVTSVPTNTWSYRMELPVDGPWVENGSTLLHALSAAGLPYDEVTGDPLPENKDIPCTIIVEGLPSNQALQQSVRVHEQHHVAELYQVVNSVLVKWDNKIKSFFENNKSTIDPDPEKCVEKFYAIVRGTPDEIGAELEKQLKEAGDAFHNEEAGKPPVISAANYNDTTKTIRLFWKYQ